MLPTRKTSDSIIPLWVCVAVSTVFAFQSETLAENWPQFRGSDASAVSTTPLPVSWSIKDGQMKNIRWKISAPGEGWSQPVVWDGQVIVTAAVPVDVKDGTGPDDDAGGGGYGRGDLMTIVFRYQVTCFDADSGAQLWQTTCKQGRPPIPRHSTNTYATETPAADGQRIYAYFGMNGV